MVNNRIRMRHLRCFLAVAQHGSVTHAAEALSTVQPSVSRTLRELEQEIGAVLFARKANGLELNSAGKTLFSYVKSGVVQIDQGLSRLHVQTQAEQISIYVLPNVTGSIMPGAIRRFKAACSGVDVQLISVANGHQSEKIRDGSVDFCIGRLAEPDKMTNMTFEHLYNEPLLFIAQSNHPLAQKEGVSVMDLDRFQVIVPSLDTIIRAELDRFVIGQGLSRFSSIIETLAMDFARTYVLNGDAVACLPLGSVQREINNGEIVTLDVKGQEMNAAVGITCLAQKHLSAPAQILLDMIREEVKLQA